MTWDRDPETIWIDFLAGVEHMLTGLPLEECRQRVLARLKEDTDPLT